MKIQFIQYKLARFNFPLFLQLTVTPIYFIFHKSENLINVSDFFFQLQKTVAWSAWLIWSRLGSSTSVYNFKSRRTSRWNPQKKSTIFTDEKPTEFHLFSSFSWRKKKNEEKPSSILLQQLYRRERLCLWICVWKNEANKKQNTIFISFLLQLEFSPYFLALQLKKKVNKWRWLSVLKQEKTKNLCENYKILIFSSVWKIIITECPNISW